jgi:hypothetical protein
MVNSAADQKRVDNLLKFTIGFTAVEALASITAGLGSSLISLLGFGLDSLIEVIAASLILQHFIIEARVGKALGISTANC